ncbi:MAG: hypothetical protein IKM15_04500 [Peptococcaceae bacterium]|nr:hypothetical protein [Peptococcaceae bacterium]
MKIEDLRILVQQFEVFLPEEQRKAIQQILAEIEESGGIRDEQHGQQLLAQLMQIAKL